MIQYSDEMGFFEIKIQECTTCHEKYELDYFVQERVLYHRDEAIEYFHKTRVCSVCIDKAAKKFLANRKNKR